VRKVTMLVQEAREAARTWVQEHAAADPGFIGAYTAGSVNWLPDDAELDLASDVDLMIVLDGTERRDKTGKVNQSGAMLDVTYLTSAELGSPEAILGHHQLGASFRTACILSDPTGRLTEDQATVTREFARRRWVERRCQAARSNLFRYLGSVEQVEQFHEQVTCWLFGTSLTTHLLLLAGLKNPTVRRRYAAARDLLTECGHAGVYQMLLEQLGCADLSRERVEHHLDMMTETFDVAKLVGRTHFFFSSEISDLARPVAIDGSRALTESGRHREAVFWIVATQARCQKVLYHDGTAEQRRHHELGFKALLADLGIESAADLRRRAAEVKAKLPEIEAVAEAIMTAIPAITDE
jgi:hypothetical protein